MDASFKKYKLVILPYWISSQMLFRYLATPKLARQPVAIIWQTMFLKQLIVTKNYCGIVLSRKTPLQRLAWSTTQKLRSRTSSTQMFILMVNKGTSHLSISQAMEIAMDSKGCLLMDTSIIALSLRLQNYGSFWPVKNLTWLG